MKKSKFRHNKKRNTAFLFEALVKELTKASLNKDDSTKKAVSEILKKHFRKGTVLHKELDLYRSLAEARGLDRITAERILSEAKRVYGFFPETGVFSAQSELIDQINKDVGESVYANFVPNYKTLATITQIFADNTSIKDRVILENAIVRSMMGETKTVEMKPISNLVYKTFVDKFNKTYGDSLHEEQKNLLTKYITSFSDNGVELSVYLNEEIGRLKDSVRQAKSSKEIKEDKNMFDNIQKVEEILNDFSKIKIGQAEIKKILKIQELVREVAE